MAKEKDQRLDLNAELTRRVRSGRLAASTETVTRVKTVAGDRKAASTKLVPKPPSPAQPKPKASPAAKAGKPAPADGSQRARAFDPRRLKQFVQGLITLGELQGISKDEQYRMAEAGHGLLRSGKLEDAERIFSGLVALDPHDAYFHLALGAIEQRRGALETADAHYTRALACNPVSLPALANRGEIRILAGKVTEGARDLLKVAELDPENLDEATKRAKALIRLVMQELKGKERSSTSHAVKRTHPRRR